MKSLRKTKSNSLKEIMTLFSSHVGETRVKSSLLKILTTSMNQKAFLSLNSIKYSKSLLQGTIPGY